MRRVLVDECLPVQLHRWLDGFEAVTVTYLGWKGLDDDAVLAAARGRFDIVLSGDATFGHGRDLAALGLALVIVPSNHKTSVRKLVPAIRDAIAAVEPGTVVVVGSEGR